eukprot:scaffold181179_cov33-Tisochrysis_lutea.AAC.3
MCKSLSALATEAADRLKAWSAGVVEGSSPSHKPAISSRDCLASRAQSFCRSRNARIAHAEAHLCSKESESVLYAASAGIASAGERGAGGGRMGRRKTRTCVRAPPLGTRRSGVTR